MQADDQWATDTYDDIVATAGEDGIPLKESRQEFADKYEEAVRTGELERPEVDLYDEGLNLFDRVVKPKRRARSRKLQDDLANIVAALNDETILGQDDPILNLAVPLGDLDGRDKVIGLWTAEDWRNATIVRYRKSAELTASASIFDEQASLIERAIVSRGIEKTFDLFGDDGQATA